MAILPLIPMGWSCRTVTGQWAVDGNGKNGLGGLKTGQGLAQRRWRPAHLRR